ncbi:hypothetical protein MSAN_00796400 [Mycena sanguinolenta]|uniref:Uncharacterized protein n=1 Tax=Mycena sanguinolenta TaxID=230812 RepID=A0A8H6Z0X8_9AGAR|nr:hypothetical protein MSAN_00796400 [Mycena sanguinolenta]
MLDTFKIKPFDLEPVYAAWTPGPRFLGDPKKDSPVDDWLEEIKKGCTNHNVPKEYWHTLVELKKVMAQVHGGHYRWNWKKFKVAMRNMSWDIDTSKTETVKVPTGPFWWLPKSTKKADPNEEEYVVCEEPAPILSRSDTIKSKASDIDRPVVGRAATQSFWPLRKNSKETVGAQDAEPAPILSRSDTIKSKVSDIDRPVAGRTATQSFWPIRKNSKEAVVVDDTTQRPVPRKAKSDGTMVLNSEVLKPLPVLPNSGDEGTTVRAPAWLLNAATALDFLQGEHPRVMSTLSAILIVAGTIPSLPAVSAGAAGAVLASSTAHAVGAIAVGLGSWIKTQQEMKSNQDTHVAK